MNNMVVLVAQKLRVTESIPGDNTKKFATQV